MRRSSLRRWKSPLRIVHTPLTPSLTVAADADALAVLKSCLSVPPIPENN
jgi:hypothetical protein